MSWPTTSDAMQVGMGPGKLGNTVDPRSPWEKMTVWEARRRCEEMGYSEAKDWTKDQCGAVIMAAPQMAQTATRRLRDANKPLADSELSRVGILASLRGMGVVPANVGELTDQELLYFFRQQKDKAHVEPRVIAAPAELVPLDHMDLNTLKKKAKLLGINSFGRGRDFLIAEIRSRQAQVTPVPAEPVTVPHAE